MSDATGAFRFAVKAMEDASRHVIDAAGWKPEDIDLVIPHQANQRIIVNTAQRLGIDMERVFSNIERYGNTSSATIPVALCEAWEEGRIKDGDLVMIEAIGGGFTWGSALIRW